MPKYEVVIKKSVFKALSKMNTDLADELENLMLSLEDNPRPIGLKN